MSFLSQSYLSSLPEDAYKHLLATTSKPGAHPETGDCFLIPTQDRSAGMHIIGLPGVGKSGLLENLAMQDILNGQAVIFIDPHGDSVDHLMAQLPYELSQERLAKVHLFDIADSRFPFGLNLLSIDRSDPLALERVLNRLMHIFTVQWPDIVGQQYIPLYLKMATHVLLDNPGSTLIETNFRTSHQRTSARC